VIERTLSEQDRVLIERELAGTLDDAERDALFERMMDEPTLAGALASAERAVYEGLRTTPATVAGGAAPIGWRPWLAMAASFAFGSVVTVLLTGPAPDQSEAIASSAVHYLDNVRGGTELPLVLVGAGDGVVTLVAYPAFDDFERLHVYLERLQRPGVPEERWIAVWDGAVGVGDRESVAVALPAQWLVAGEHRLRAEGVAADGGVLPAGSVRFEVRR
jgi:hypothetical protein